MDGLSEKLTDILADNADTIRRYKEEEEKLIGKLRFFSEHNFEEEKRITMVKYNASNMILYNYKEMYDNVQKAIANLNS